MAPTITRQPQIPCLDLPACLFGQRTQGVQVNHKKKTKKSFFPTTPIIKPRASADSKGRAEDILKLIRSRDEERFTVPEWERGKGIWQPQEPDTVDNKPMTADTWQTFKRDFIEEYGGEPVKETGFTDSEFLEWFKHDKRELHHEPGKLQTLLAELNAHGTAVSHNHKTRKKPKKNIKKKTRSEGQ